MRNLWILETVKIEMIPLANLLAGEREKKDAFHVWSGEAGTQKHGVAADTDRCREAAGGGGWRSRLGGGLH